LKIEDGSGQGIQRKVKVAETQSGEIEDGMHIRNIFKQRELRSDSVVKDFFTTADDGQNYLTRCYNLDVIISVGYRVKMSRLDVEEVACLRSQTVTSNTGRGGRRYVPYAVTEHIAPNAG